MRISGDGRSKKIVLSQENIVLRDFLGIAPLTMVGKITSSYYSLQSKPLINLVPKVNELTGTCI